MNVIEKALQVASRAHVRQCRKHTDIPYITHPVAVGMMLMKAGYGDDIVAAGILHDTVEDTTLSLADIEREFGLTIASIVEGCSEPDKSLSWEKRKQHTIEFLKTAPEDIKVVACADKLHNIRSIMNDYEQIGDMVWERFNRGKVEQEWYYRNVIESLGYQSNFKLIDELKVEVERFFGPEDTEIPSSNE
ncbi:HD domain-containing protein [Neobacillus soli]|uniref:HD domain-containing protein n=1 Tax=Neobacillus soli TaxID=220688 RepID=UPI0008240BD4|nr:HD domain-containing protein [Neobacillus soli]